MKGQGGIKGLFLQHGEKIVIALVGLAAVFLVYKATSLPRLKDEFQASKLQEQISQTSSAVRNATWPDPKNDPELFAEVKEAQPVDVKQTVAVNSQSFALSTGGFNSRVVASSILRTDPPLLNAEDVIAIGGSGLFAITDEKIRKAQELEARAKQDELAKKAAEQQEKDRNNQQQAGEGGPGAGRRGRNTPEMVEQPFDPEHPSRRPVEGMATASLGVPRQGGERIERAYWACVVAKVPIRNQLKLFQDAFEKAKLGYDPSRDFPQYKGMLIERAEVVQGKPLEWKPVPLFDGQRSSILANKPLSSAPMHGIGDAAIKKLYEAAALYWPAMMPDVIDPRFADPMLTLPLPPLVGRNFGADATHPDIPLIADTPPLEEEQPPMPENVPTLPGQQPADDFASTSGAAANPAMGFPQPGGRLGVPGMMRQGPGMMGRGELMMGRGEMMGGPMMRRGIGEGGPEGGGRAMGSAMMPGTVRTSLPKGVDNLLLRFFDFSVEPGKKYKYRVALVLADPNHSIPDTLNALAPEVLDRRRKKRQEFRRVEGWSEESPVVGVPLAGNVRLAEVKVPSAEKYNDEPSATLLVESFDVDAKNNAIQAAKQREFRRGNVANFVDDVEYLGGDMQPWIDTKKEFKFDTGMTLLDVDGGKRLTKDYTAPGRVIVMGSAGELYIRNELDDKPFVDYHKELFRKDKHRFGAEGMGPGGGEGMRPRGPGGRGR